MAPPADDPFQPMDGGFQGGQHPHDRGRPSVSSKDLARNAARDAIHGEGGEGEPARPRPNTASPGTRFDSTVRPGGDRDEPLESDTSQFVEPEPMGDEGDEPQRTGGEGGEDFEEDDTPFQPSAILTDEDQEALESVGVNVPENLDEAPAEIQDAYAQLAQSMLDTRAAAEEQVRDAQEAILRVEDFAERLSTEEGQQRLLLGMALQNSEVFENAVQMFTRMQEDPEFAESVRRGLEAELKYEAAERKERAFNQAARERKAQQVERRTTRLAQQTGVDVQLAKEMVASRILQNEAENGVRDITMDEVDQVVKGLAQRVGAKPKPRVKDPATRQKEAQANRKPAQGSGRDAPAQRDDDRGRIRERHEGGAMDVMDRLRGAVRVAADRTRSKGL